MSRKARGVSTAGLVRASEFGSWKRASRDVEEYDD